MENNTISSIKAELHEINLKIETLNIYLEQLNEAGYSYSITIGAKNKIQVTLFKREKIS